MIRSPLPRRFGRIRWRWPLPVGFLADDLSRSLRDDLYATAGVRTNLTEPEVGAARPDLLLLPYFPSDALDAVRRASPRPDATCVVLLTTGPIRPNVHRIVELAEELSARGIVVMGLPTTQRVEWFKALLAKLSHDEPLGKALRGAAKESHARMRIFGPAAFFERVRLSDSIVALQEQMMATANGGTIDIPEDSAMELGVPPTASAREVAERIRPTDLSFGFEREGATHSARVSRAARPMVEDAERRQATARFILATVGDRTGNRTLRSGFRAGGAHDIEVWIGPKHRRAIAGNVRFPDEKLPKDKNGHRLTVVFMEPDLLSKPQVQTIELPVVGRSDAARFTLTVPTGAHQIEARIAVLHRGRILQTALLRGPVLKPKELEDGRRRGIKILIEAVLRPGFADLDDRQRFDAAVILNHTRGGRAIATVLGRRKLASLAFGAAEAASKAIGDVFFDAEKDDAFNRELGSENSLGYLRRMAGKGTLLYERIGKAIEAVHGGRTREVPYIQILSANPTSFLPVELIYDLPTPAQDAKLCPNAEKALQEGRCEAKFHKEDEEGHLEVVCPSGFWGVTKVIERHAIDPNRLVEDPRARGVDFLAVTDPVGGRKTLDAIAPLLFAASDHVNDVDAKELSRVTKSLDKLMGKKLLEADTWKGWVGHIKKEEPPMLLLLSHTEPASGGAALEINNAAANQRRFVDEINEHYVNLNGDRVGPLVLLIGCDTGVISPSDFQSFVAQFKDKGASMVVGTIAPILGRHASRVAEALVEEMKTIGAIRGRGDRGVPFGAVMRQIRRNLLARGILISLALTSYGDADWRLAPA